MCNPNNQYDIISVVVVVVVVVVEATQYTFVPESKVLQTPQ
jgi:hypothetical protein